MLITEKIDDLCEKLRLQIAHPYIEATIGRPAIDRDRLAVYYALFQYRENAAGETCVLSLMAAEIALATHERMTNEPVACAMSVKERQLLALSGDYYSALYYRLLADAGEIEVTRWVAEAIQYYNSSKCALFYPQQRMNWQDAMRMLRAFESALMNTMAVKLGLSEWTSLFESFFLLKRLHHEYAHYSLNDSVLSGALMRHLSRGTATLKQHINQEIEKTKHFLSHQILANEHALSGTGKSLFQYLKVQSAGYGSPIVKEGENG
ncbi:MAG: heptaprenyl diphosphate synthase component 1 [Sporolactobacillus sp.]